MIKILVKTVLLTLISSTALGAERSSEENFVLGNFEFVLLHELAHVIIGENDVPILGPLESAADYTAVIMAIRGGKDDSEANEFLSQALKDTATAFAKTWRLAQENKIDIPYWDVHALSIQRYYAALCLIYGSNPTQNRALLSELPQGRAAGCSAEFELADQGFQWLVETYGSSSVEPESSLITFSYGRVASTRHQELRDEIRQLGLLENTVNAVLGLFPPKEPLQVKLRTCGQPEAAWQPDERELVICYELFDGLSQVYRTKSRGGSRRR